MIMKYSGCLHCLSARVDCRESSVHNKRAEVSEETLALKSGDSICKPPFWWQAGVLGNWMMTDSDCYCSFGGVCLWNLRLSCSLCPATHSAASDGICSLKPIRLVFRLKPVLQSPRQWMPLRMQHAAIATSRLPAQHQACKEKLKMRRIIRQWWAHLDCCCLVVLDC